MYVAGPYTSFKFWFSIRTTTSWSKLPVAWSRTGSPAGIVEGPRRFLESALAPTSAATRRRIDAATAPTRLNRKSMRDFSRKGRMLLEREPQGLVARAFEFARGRMRATRVQNPGHRRTAGIFAQYLSIWERWSNTHRKFSESAPVSEKMVLLE